MFNAAGGLFSTLAPVVETAKIALYTIPPARKVGWPQLLIPMGNLKKKRRLKMNKHKRRKRSKAHRHKKRLWG